MNIIRSWWSNFSKEELQKFSFLSLIFGMIIGTYWLLRPLKVSIFMSVIGSDYIPHAKIMSLIVIFPLVMIYSKLVDIFPRQKMFYVLLPFYMVLGLFFAFLMCHPTIGLANCIPNPHRWWGWLWYIYTESFGILLISLFWAFVADITTPASASHGYPLIALGGQIGNIVAPFLLKTLMNIFTHAQEPFTGELPPAEALSNALVLASIVVGSVVSMAIIMILITLFMRITPKQYLVGFQEKKSDHFSNQSFLDGIKLILSSPYLLGIFSIMIFNGVIGTLMDINFNTLVQKNFPNVHIATAYLASHATWVGIVSTLSILCGINKIQELLGIGLSLTLLPLLVASAVFISQMNTTVTILFWIIVLLKAINYALNQPSMKQLFIPTTYQAKYQSQAFIEVYGSRSSRALGSGINLLQKCFINHYGLMMGMSLFSSFYMAISFGMIGIWIFIALFLGRTYKKAVETSKVVI